MSELPLDGVTVIDFSTLLPGPLASLMLQEAGAKVIKIERSGGEEMRNFHPKIDGMSALYAQLNRGKECLELDLKNGSDRTSVVELIKNADIVLEQFRPGVMEKLGLDYAALSSVNPALIYCSITGYGQKGSLAHKAGHDLNYIAASGLLSVSSGGSDKPVVPPTQIADIGAGTFPAYSNILLALLNRHKSGKGCHIDIAMCDGTFVFSCLAQAVGQAGGKFPVDGNWLLTGGSPRYQLYPASDSRLVAVGALEQKFWNIFCATIELPHELRDDLRNPLVTLQGVANIIGLQTYSHWQKTFEKVDCCVNIVATLEEAFEDPHFIERGLFAHKTRLGADTVMSSIVLPIDNSLRRKPSIKTAPVSSSSKGNV